MSQTPEQTVKDALDPARVAACAAVLDRPAPGDLVPPFWHHLYFWEVRPPSELGRDGHIAKGVGLIPDLGLPRRMWAGGSLEWLAPLRSGASAEKHTSVSDITRKTGRSGPLALVTLTHRIRQGGALCLRERQNLVYRPDPAPDDPPPAPQPAKVAPVEETRAFDAVTLVRYSGLTMNSHRIHWDEAYARDVEGHAGLVVHGPLLAEGLIDLVTRHLGPLRTFEYRATAPATADEPLTFCLDGGSAFVRGADGRLCMTATAQVI
ncbi:MAG: acyl dehydratase [Jannaschia sp.]